MKDEIVHDQVGGPSVSQNDMAMHGAVKHAPVRVRAKPTPSTVSKDATPHAFHTRGGSAHCRYAGTRTGQSQGNVGGS